MVIFDNFAQNLSHSEQTGSYLYWIVTHFHVEVCLGNCEWEKDVAERKPENLEKKSHEFRVNDVHLNQKKINSSKRKQ